MSDRTQHHTGSQPGPPALPWKWFPTYTLPPAVESYTDAAACAIGCDPAFVALPLLTALGAAIGNSRRLLVKRGWLAPPLLWTTIVGESGTHKSPALDYALLFTRQRQQRLFTQHERDRQRYEVAKDEGEPATLPVCQRCLVEDVTAEAIVPRLVDSPRGLLAAREELSGWVNSLNQYKRGKGSDLAQFLTMYDARQLITDRKHGDATTIFVPQAFVAITGGVQPGTLRRLLTPEYIEAGLAARLLLAMPPWHKIQWSEAEVHPDLEQRLARVFEYLCDLQPLAGEHGPLPEIVRMSPPAKEEWRNFFDRHAAEQAELTGPLASAWSKLRGYCPRLALILHCVHCAETGEDTRTPLESHSLLNACDLVSWFGHEARRVYAMLQHTEEEAQQQTILDIVRRKDGSLKARDLQRIQPKRYPTADDARQALERLAQAGHLRRKSTTPGPGGGAPTVVYHLADDEGY